MTETAEDGVSLGSLLQRSLSDSESILESSPINQTRLAVILSNLELCQRLIQHLDVVSRNEELQDISTATLPCFLVPFQRALLTMQLKSTGTVMRQEHLTSALEHLNEFIAQIKQHRILDPLPNVLSASDEKIDQATRRSNKIQMYRKEKELKALLANAKLRAQSSENDDEQLRSAFLIQIQLAYVNAHAELDSAHFERDLLKASIPMSDLPHGDPSEHTRLQDDTWKLDRPQTQQRSWFDANAGPVLSNGGKILRPFTITSSNLSTSDRLQTRLSLKEQVFQSGHRLPTMTIDEFLENEFNEGRVLQGGEADAQRQDEESRVRKQLVEMDNLEAYQADEDRIAEARRQDEYRDTHRRGDGNRIGRG